MMNLSHSNDQHSRILSDLVSDIINDSDKERVISFVCSDNDVVSVSRLPLVLISSSIRNIVKDHPDNLHISLDQVTGVTAQALPRLLTGSWSSETTWSAPEIELFTHLGINIPAVQVCSNNKNDINDDVIDELLKDDPELVSEDEVENTKEGNPCSFEGCSEMSEDNAKLRVHLGLTHFKEELELMMMETFEEDQCSFCASVFIMKNDAKMKHLLSKHELLKDKIDRHLKNINNHPVSKSNNSRKRKGLEILDDDQQLAVTPKVKKCKVMLKKLPTPRRESKEELNMSYGEYKRLESLSSTPRARASKSSSRRKRTPGSLTPKSNPKARTPKVRTPKTPPVRRTPLQTSKRRESVKRVASGGKNFSRNVTVTPVLDKHVKTEEVDEVLSTDDDTLVENPLFEENVEVQRKITNDSPTVKLSYKKKPNVKKDASEEFDGNKQQKVNTDSSTLVSDIDRIVSMLQESQDNTADEASVKKDVSVSKVKPVKVEDDLIMIEEDDTLSEESETLSTTEEESSLARDIHRSLMSVQDLSDDEDDDNFHDIGEESDNFEDVRESLMKELGIVDL